ncbi:MAG: RNA methyltransferase [Chitinophagaceae bacterium]|nr:RNA methyltransferase [Chitinophagaceae bacterium]
MTPERKARLTYVLDNRQPDLAVVMENINDPHNIFAIMRTCDAIGVQDIYIVNTPIKRHRKFGKASSTSATKWVTRHEFDDLDTCLSVVRSRYNKLYASYLGESSYGLYDMDMTESVALVFGNEREGITDEMLAKCDGTFLIPQVGMIRSLNVSVACAVTLYEAMRQRMSKGLYGNSRMATANRKNLADDWGMYE